MTPIIEDLMGINPSHTFVHISDISLREILVNSFFSNKYI